MSERQSVNDEMTPLRVILARNGFGAAASNLRWGEVRENIEDLIRSWDEYPRTMERYPLHLSKKIERPERIKGYR